MKLFHRLIECVVLLSLVRQSDADPLIRRSTSTSNGEKSTLRRELQSDPCDGADPTLLPADPTQTPSRIEAEDFCHMWGVQTEDTADPDGGGLNVGWIDSNDWVAFPIQVQTQGMYLVEYRLATPEGIGSLDLEWYGGLGVLGSIGSLPSTGDWQTFETVSHEVELPAGSHTVAVKATTYGFNINWLQFSLLEATSSEPTSSPTQACPIMASTPEIPAKIEAEDFCDSYGIDIEETEDTGGGPNVGWIDGGDWIAFLITVPTDGEYSVSYRVASPSGRGSFDLEWYGGLGVLGTIDTLPATGDWQNWETVSHIVELPAGTHRLAVKAMSGGWNLHWLELTIPQPSSSPTPAPSSSAAPTPFPSISSAPTQTQPTRSPNSIATAYGGFLRAQGKSIVNEQGDPVILRGMGFGGWMVQEPYMMLLSGILTEGQHSMFEQIQALTSTDDLKTYHKAWLDNYCTEADVMELAQSGFNSLRVALHYNLFTLPIEEEPVRGQDTWLSDGFERLDKLLEWCENAGIYLILDLHAAPGGQGVNADINDYDSSKPSLWEDPENVRKTIALWEQLAIRYSDRSYIGGYDLVNEVNWAFEGGNPVGCDDVVNAPLKDLYDRAIAAIRAVDTKHIIFIEGNCFANNHEGLWPFDDDNLVLSFHRYWILNTLDTIQEYLDLSDEYNVPLWMGESGENTNWWFRDAVQLLESNGIGWAWWTWKKMSPNAGFSDTSGSSSFSIIKPDGYQTLIDYWQNPYGNPKPDRNFTFDTMMEVANNVLLENTVRNDGAIDALTGHVLRPCDSITELLDTSELVKIEAEYYCEMDGFLTDPTDDVGGGAAVGFTDAEDWLTYKISVPDDGTYVVEYRYASPEGDGSLQLELDDGSVLGTIRSFPITGDWQNWETISHEVDLPSGSHTLVVRAVAPGWNLNWLAFSKADRP